MIRDLPRLGVLGYPPFWFKSAAYRARDPRDLAGEWGTIIPDNVKLPERPAGTEGWSAEQLAVIVREGDMIGVTVPKAA